MFGIFPGTTREISGNNPGLEMSRNILGHVQEMPRMFPGSVREMSWNFPSFFGMFILFLYYVYAMCYLLVFFVSRWRGTVRRSVIADVCFSIFRSCCLVFSIWFLGFFLSLSLFCSLFLLAALEFSLYFLIFPRFLTGEDEQAACSCVRLQQDGRERSCCPVSPSPPSATQKN